MQEKIVCVNCHNEVPANIRLKGNQQYCGAKACQNARKAQWKRNKMAADPDFAAKQKKSQQHWRKNKPAPQYQKLIGVFFISLSRRPAWTFIL